MGSRGGAKTQRGDKGTANGMRGYVVGEWVLGVGKTLAYKMLPIL